MASVSNHRPVAALLAVILLFSHSVAKLHESSEHPCKFDSNGDDDLEEEKERNAQVQGCHFAGTCSAIADCRQPCAALGRNPDAVKCVPDSAADGNRCCCIN